MRGGRASFDITIGSSGGRSYLYILTRKIRLNQISSAAAGYGASRGGVTAAGGGGLLHLCSHNLVNTRRINQNSSSSEFRSVLH